MNTDSKLTTVAQIALDVPGATQVFRKFGVDFCCNGNRPLSEACGTKLADVTQALEDLKKETQVQIVSADEETEKLIDLILRRYHARHRVDLSELMQMANKVERVHSDKEGCPKGLYRQIERMSHEMNDHMMKEEEVLFPAILQGADPQWLQHPIAAMEADHRQLGADLEELRLLCHNFVLPEDACTTWRALYNGVQSFIQDLMEHVHLENNLLFPRVTASV